VSPPEQGGTPGVRAPRRGEAALLGISALSLGLLTLWGRWHMPNQITTIHGRWAHRHVISRLYTLMVNAIARNSLRYYNGCPIYRRHDVLRWHVEATGFGYQAEFLTRLLHEGKSYVEVPAVAWDRAVSGALTPRDFLSVGHSLLKIGLRQLRVRLFK
jgi:hypothetical protein